MLKIKYKRYNKIKLNSNLIVSLFIKEVIYNYPINLKNISPNNILTNKPNI